MELSALQTARYAYVPKLPPELRGAVADIKTLSGAATEAATDRAELRAAFPRTYGMPVVEFVRGANPAAGSGRKLGVVLSGGQAPGGHNVIAGLLDGLRNGNAGSGLVGFLGGPSGIVSGSTIELTPELVGRYRNTGGFDIIGSGRTKLETPEQFAKAAETCRRLGLSGLVVIGGDDSNTNAAVLAEYFASTGAGITVVGVPKTIDGDLKNDFVETSFGFDTATKTYAELIGNIERDASSARKYWHFIKLMGRSASHIAVECALLTQPNVAIISEEVRERGETLASIVERIADVVAKRSEQGNNFGVALIPEGLVEFIPEIGRLIAELNDLLAKESAAFAAAGSAAAQHQWIVASLSGGASAVFDSLPAEIRAQLLAERDPHGNVQVAKIETERLLSVMVERRLGELRAAGGYRGSFSPVHHYFGYEGRCAFPSNFDADYCYTLGYCAFLLAAAGCSGYMASVRNLARPAAQWKAGGIPITMMMNMERRHGSTKPVIRKSLVELEGKPFAAFAAGRDRWALSDSYVFPGAIQYFGPEAVCDQPSVTLRLERDA